MILTGAEARVLQVHPTLRCNLACLHCYSSSGPTQRGELPLAVLAPALADAAAEGFNVVSISGGEPLLYGPLLALLDAAAACGLAATIASNGTVLTAARAAALRGRIGLLSISVDGAPATHDRVRARAGAFAQLTVGVARARDAGIPLGILFTLTRDNAGELPWVARFAADHGAALLQIHALELAGRAAVQLADAAPDDTLHAAAWLAAAQLRERHPALAIHVDVVDRAALATVDVRTPDELTDARLAELVSPLVVEADGQVVPLQHGFPRGHALGSLHDASLAQLAARWRDHGFLAFQDACGRVLRRLQRPAELPFVSLYQELARLAPPA